jgi:hypothetical protein
VAIDEVARRARLQAVPGEASESNDDEEPESVPSYGR